MKLSEIVGLITLGAKGFAMVPVSKMRVDHAYQRVLKARVKKMIARWDYNKCDVLIVSFRDGYFYVVDGQHRYEAAKANGVEFLACQILEEMTQIDEAKCFLAQNTEACSLTPYDTWNANLLIGDIVDCTIDKVCREYNVTVQGNRGVKQAAILGSLTEARIIVKQHGADGLRWILNVLDAAKWDEQRRGHGTNIMRGLKNFYGSHKENLFAYTDRVKCLLFKNSPQKFQAKAIAMFPENEAVVAISRYLDFMVTGEPSENVSAEENAA